MNAIEQAAADLAAALETVQGLAVARDLGANLDPPAAVVDGPALTWRAHCVEPTDARFLVHLVVASGPDAQPLLWRLLPVVSVALDAEADATVIRADPALHQVGGAELPCYEIQVDVALGG
ncbi:hypothetical protein [Micromonospora aurantiaca (nom. illeg.)]|uniref:hypothetical protein n=1 Tax=Micromonospora aurantiaca (nom. illeg.) TaxID=47850 RepID=UPI003F49D385